MASSIRYGWVVVFGVGAVCAATVFVAALDKDKAHVAARMQAGPAAPHAPATGGSKPPKLPETQSPAPVIASVVAKPVSEHDAAANADWLAPQVSGPSLLFEDLPHYLGQRLAVVTTGDHVHQGTLVAVTPRRITLLIRRSGGTARYTLRREQVTRIDVP